MIDFSSFISEITDSRLETWAALLPEQIDRGLSIQRYGDLPEWYDALAALPDLTASNLDFKTEVLIGKQTEINGETKDEIESSLRRLIPWRKGPFSIFGIDIDTEWRSDFKWDRLLPHISPLKNKMVLDVGCGNGYHCWRMWGEGAQRVIGIDPSPRFVVQFYMLKKFVPGAKVDVLPMGLEALPEKLEAFDTTFSMGVLYHRKSPFDHLAELMGTLKPGGELVLETLVIDGGSGEVLVPEGRYAMMNNVWFLPSVQTLLSWLKKSGFHEPRCVDINQTSTDEQRATEWMRFYSLRDFLDPHNPGNTVEGHPAPRRAMFIARKPEK